MQLLLQSGTTFESCLAVLYGRGLPADTDCAPALCCARFFYSSRPPFVHPSTAVRPGTVWTQVLK